MKLIRLHHEAIKPSSLRMHAPFAVNRRWMAPTAYGLLFIDLLLKEAGWPLDQKRDREFPVSGMPNRSLSLRESSSGDERHFRGAKGDDGNRGRQNANCDRAVRYADPVQLGEASVVLGSPQCVSKVPCDLRPF